MCWQVALPLLMSAAGTAVQYGAQNDAKRQQERELAAGILKQGRMNREADTQVQQATQQIAASNPDAERAQKRNTYIDALRRAQPGRAAVQGNVGNVSERFTADSSAAANDAETEAAGLADLTAEIEAPAYQRMREGNALADTADKLSLIRGRSSGQDYLTRLRTAMIRPNAGQVAAGQVISGFGQGMGENGGYGEGGEPLPDVGGNAAIAPVKPRARRVGNGWVG
jgi:hypothetical protein